VRVEVADFNVISDTSKTLANVLAAGLAPIGADCQVNDLFVPIGLPPPKPLLTLTLYEIIEDPSARNRPTRRKIDTVTGKVITNRAPAAMLLRYILAPWSGKVDTDHVILGRAIQTLYDNAIISGSDLVGTLFSAQEALKITMVPMSIEDRTHVWRSIESKYRLSANYEVRVVNIDATKQIVTPAIVNRRVDYGTLEGDA
jgi:hypothetical protein